MHKLAGFITLLMGCLLLSGCGNDALNSLKQDGASAQYNGHFWFNEQKQKTPLWKDATDFCMQKDNQMKTNCLTINQLVGFAEMADFAKQGPHQGFGPDSVPKP